MAAARAATIGLAAVDQQTEAQLAGLNAGWDTALARHRSLAASMAWSYDLLDPEDQRTLRSLGVFLGSFSLEAANAVAGPQAEARIAELVRRSLVVRDSANRTRYRLLDSTRRFALDHLSEAGEEHAARDRHATFMAEHFARSVVLWEQIPTRSGTRPISPTATTCARHWRGQSRKAITTDMSNLLRARRAISCRQALARRASEP